MHSLNGPPFIGPGRHKLHSIQRFKGQLNGTGVLFIREPTKWHTTRCVIGGFQKNVLQIFIIAHLNERIIK